LTPRIYAVGRSLFGTGHRDLDDVAQESLLAFFRALPSFESRSTVLHFATRIAVRTCLAHRKRARRHEVTKDAHDPDEASADTPRVHMDEAAHHRREAVRALLEALPDVQAEALALRICLGLSLAQVAAATDTPQNTVRSRLRLARQALLRRVESNDALRALVEDAT
jgi:RNA polymerase sigma-70 factor (ECF subfamily)